MGQQSPNMGQIILVRIPKLADEAGFHPICRPSIPFFKGMGLGRVGQHQGGISYIAEIGKGEGFGRLALGRIGRNDNRADQQKC